jgi:hypothetical protein
MRSILLTRLLIILGFAAAFVAGWFAASERVKSASGATTGAAEGSAAAGAGSVSGSGGGESQAGFAAAEAIDPAITIDSLMATAANEPPGLARFALLHAAMQRITRENWHAAWVTMWKARNEGLISEDEMRYVLQRLGEVAGAAMVEAVKPKDPENAYETHFGRYAMKGWAAKDPAAAKAWLETQPAGKFREGMTWGYVLGTSLRDVPEGLRAMRELDPERQAGLLGYTLKPPDGHRYQALAEAWLTANNAPGTPGVRAENDAVTNVFNCLLNTQIAVGSVEKKNEKFLAWVEGIESKPWFGPQNVGSIGQEFARRNESSRGLEWVDRFTSEQPEAGRGAVRGIMAQWTTSDPASAAAWLNDHGTSPHYDDAVSTFLGAQRGRLDHETAQAWASSIHDEKLRQMLLNQLR